MNGFDLDRIARVIRRIRIFGAVAPPIPAAVRILDFAIVCSFSLGIEHDDVVAFGDMVVAGERIGLIKFGSRTDVLFGPEWQITAKVGERVSAGSSVIATRKDRQ